MAVGGKAGRARAEWCACVELGAGLSESIEPLISLIRMIALNVSPQSGWVSCQAQEGFIQMEKGGSWFGGWRSLDLQPWIASQEGDEIRQIE